MTPKLAACLVAVAAVLGAGQAAGTDRADRPPIRIGVRGDEFNLILSRTRVEPGPAIVQFQNVGEDAHDLKLQRVGSAAELGTGEIGPGGVASLPRTRLRRASKYRLWCSLENHASYGMEATLRVKKRRSRR